MKLGPHTNLQVMTVLVCLGVLLAGGVVAAFAIQRSSWATRQGFAPHQPVPFSHAHHVGGLGIHCLYCHQHVEDGPHAGIPSTEVCMTCHAQLYTRADMLAPVRASWDSGVPIPWTRVYDLPDHAYFDHSVHVTAGVPCEHCHGRVDQQPLTVKVHALHMQWCLECHRHPGPHLRPPHAVYDMGWSGPPVAHAPVDLRGLTSCSACHR